MIVVKFSFIFNAVHAIILQNTESIICPKDS